MRSRAGVLLLLAACLGIWCYHILLDRNRPPRKRAAAPAAAHHPAVLSPVQRRILDGAKARAAKGARYSAAYARIAYPGGDVDDSVGACTDVVVRSLRNAVMDLQQLVHEDMQKRFEDYPKRWGLTRPDPNIDHRRCPNLIHFFEKYAQALPRHATPATRADWQPGDIVFWKLPGGLQHCGIVSDTLNGDGIPFVVHNIDTCREEDVLEKWEITAHFRYPPAP